MVFVNLSVQLGLRIRIVERGVLLHEQVEHFLFSVDRLRFNYTRGGLVEQWAVLPPIIVDREVVVEIELEDLLCLALGFEGEVAN